MIRLQSIFPNYSTTTRDFSEFFQVPICWMQQVLKLTYSVQEEVSLFHEATKGWAEEKVWFWTKLHLFSSLECSHERLVNEISNQVLSMTVDPLAIEAWKRMELSNFSQIYKSSDLNSTTRSGGSPPDWRSDFTAMIYWNGVSLGWSLSSHIAWTSKN